MRIVNTLPPCYRKTKSTDSEHPSFLTSSLILLFAFISALALIPLARFVPVPVWDMDQKTTILHLLAFCGCLGGCLLVCEVLRNLLLFLSLLISGAKTTRYRFEKSGILLSCEDYFSGSSLFFVNLIPDLLVCLSLITASFFVPSDWFLVLYAALIFYISESFSKYPTMLELALTSPRGALFQQSGTTLTVWSETAEVIS